jgi:hypothetical protein
MAEKAKRAAAEGAGFSSRFYHGHRGGFAQRNPTAPVKNKNGNDLLSGFGIFKICGLVPAPR